MSYRRAPADHARWVRQVAEDIRGRGYDVILDDFISENDGVVSVPELVANLANCTLFVPIITSDYALRVEPDGIHIDKYVSIGIDDDFMGFR